MLIGVVEDFFVLRIVHWSCERGMQQFQIVVVALDCAARFSQPLPGRLFVAGHPGKPHAVPVQQKMPVIDLDFPVSKRVFLLVQSLSSLSHVHADRIQISVIQIP